MQDQRQRELPRHRTEHDPILAGEVVKDDITLVLRNAKGDYEDGVILDLDLWLVLPR